MSKRRHTASAPRDSNAVIEQESSFNSLLQETVRQWAAKIDMETRSLSNEQIEVTVRYAGKSLSYVALTLSKDNPYTTRNAASALWARTAVLWRAPTPEGFFAFMHLDASDPASADQFEEWRQLARACVDMFGNTWGNSALLRKQAQADNP